MGRWGAFCLATLVVALMIVCAPVAAVAGGYKVTQVWGEAGEGHGQIQVPKGVAVAPDGSAWVVDYHNETLLKYAASGEVLGTWGGLGRAHGEFDRPSRVAVGPDGTVYVTDAANHRIQRFSQAGRFLGQWGRPGTGPGEFDYPRGIDVARDGTVYVTDQANYRVQVFTASGRYLRQWGRKGRGPGEFSLPKDIGVSDAGRVYVVDARTDRVQIFSTNGRFLGSFGGPGSARGRLSGPRGLCVDARGHVFIADAMNHRIEEFSATGAFVCEWGVEGALDGLFQAPRDIAQAPDGSLVVADTYNHRLQRFVKDDSADDNPPVTTCSRHTGWYAAPLELALTAADAASEVAATYASVDGSKFHSVADRVELGGQGRHVVRFFSVDAAANQERIRRLAFVLDWKAPGVSFGTRAPLRVFTGATVHLSVSVADALSPVCPVWIRLDRDGERVWLKSLGQVEVTPFGRSLQQAITAPRSAGRYVLTVTARDLAGNIGRRSFDLLVRIR